MTSPLVELEVDGPIATVTLARPDKRNAINDGLLEDLERALIAVPNGTRALVLAARGGHFCAGLDLSELEERTPAEVVRHSQSWQRVFARIAVGGIPAIAALHGGVIGGGLELAAATHVRVGEPDTFFQLPEGRHGIFVGGGGSVRVARIIGTGRMCEMMLTNRRVDVDEAHALGLVHYRVGTGDGLAEARRIAELVSENAPLSNYAITTVLPRISNMASDDGMLVESLAAALTSTDDAARRRIGAFLHDRQAADATATEAPSG
jgi:(methylthio)acryloyl-CoA hydratase